MGVRGLAPPPPHGRAPPIWWGFPFNIGGGERRSIAYDVPGTTLRRRLPRPRGGPDWPSKEGRHVPTPGAARACLGAAMKVEPGVPARAVKFRGGLN